MKRCKESKVLRSMILDSTGKLKKYLTAEEEYKIDNHIKHCKICKKRKRKVEKWLRKINKLGFVLKRP